MVRVKCSFQESQKTKPIPIVFAFFSDFNLCFEEVRAALELYFFFSRFLLNSSKH